MPESEPHDEFLELCAASTTGDLSDDETRRLREHLVVCSRCRKALHQYESIARATIPSIAASEEPEHLPVDIGWSEESQDKAERALLESLSREEKKSNIAKGRSGSSFFPHRILPFSTDSTWHSVWVLYAAGVLLFCALSFFAYRSGVHRATKIVEAPQAPPAKPDFLPSQTSLEEQLSDAGHDRAVASTELAQRDRVIADLRRQMARQSVEIAGLKAAQTQLANDLRTDDANRRELVQQKTELTQKLESAESGSQALQERLDSLAQQSVEEAGRAKVSDARVKDLTRLLQNQEAALNQRDELLAHDRDIREVMGARDLYIAEIYDVAGTGETKKPYGRVFYTRGKSLIFYAYDLDQQGGLKAASTFQAWGRRGPDRQQAINLGVFFEDSASRKRWILKCDDPRTLAQIDAVFVTIEPEGGSHKPSNKTLLFASLKIDPNHP